MIDGAEKAIPLEDFAYLQLKERFNLQEIGADGHGLRAFLLGTRR